MTTGKTLEEAVFVAAAVFALALPQNLYAATAASETAIAVDVRAPACRAVGQIDIGYSPKWGGVTNAGAYVVLSKVVGGTTNTVATFAADAESSYSYTPDPEDPRFVQFIHRVFTSGGEEIGEPLVGDVMFGYRSAAGGAFIADSRTNSLQLAVNERRPVSLAYSTAWGPNATAVTISSVKLTGQGGTAVATNTMFTAVADAEGDTIMRGAGRGWWRLLYRSTDGVGSTLLEYLTDEFKVPGGIIVNFK